MRNQALPGKQAAWFSLMPASVVEEALLQVRACSGILDACIRARVNGPALDRKDARLCPAQQVSPFRRLDPMTGISLSAGRRTTAPPYLHGRVQGETIDAGNRWVNKASITYQFTMQEEHEQRMTAAPRVG